MKPFGECRVALVGKDRISLAKITRFIFVSDCKLICASSGGMNFVARKFGDTLLDFVREKKGSSPLPRAGLTLSNVPKTLGEVLLDLVRCMIEEGSALSNKYSVNFHRIFAQFDGVCDQLVVHAMKN